MSEAQRVIHEWRHEDTTPYRRVLLADGTTEVQFRWASGRWFQSNDALAAPASELFLRVAEPVPAEGVQLNEWYAPTREGSRHRRVGYPDGSTQMQWQRANGSWEKCGYAPCVQPEPEWRWQPHVTGTSASAESAAPSAKDLQAEVDRLQSVVAALRLQTDGDAGRIHVLKETRDALLEDIRTRREEIRCLKQSLELSQEERQRLFDENARLKLRASAAEQQIADFREAVQEIL